MYGSSTFNLVEEYGNMYEYFELDKMIGDPVLTRELDPGTPDLEQWIIENRDRLRKQFGSDA